MSGHRIQIDDGAETYEELFGEIQEGENWCASRETYGISNMRGF